MSQPASHSDQTLQGRDPDFVGAELALKRAALKARERAKQTGRGIFIWKDGQVIEELQETDIEHS